MSSNPSLPDDCLCVCACVVRPLVVRPLVVRLYVLVRISAAQQVAATHKHTDTHTHTHTYTRTHARTHRHKARCCCCCCCCCCCVAAKRVAGCLHQPVRSLDRPAAGVCPVGTGAADTHGRRGCAEIRPFERARWLWLLL